MADQYTDVERPGGVEGGASRPLWLDPLTRRELLWRGGRFALRGLLVLPVLAAGCAGSGGSGDDGEDYASSFDTPDAVRYVARLIPSATQHYDANTGLPVDGCPSCQFDAPPSEGGAMTYGVVFEGDDQSAFAGSDPSTFQPINGTGPTPPEPSAAGPDAVRRPADDGQFGVQFFRYFYVRGGRIETHPLKPCVDMDVLHTHLIIKRTKDTPDAQAYFKLHLGVYPNGANKCYVLYDSQHKSICFNVCFPDDRSNYATELQSVFHEALAAGFAALSVAVADWVLALAADVLATASLALLVAL